MRGMEGVVCGGVGEGKYMFCTLRLHKQRFVVHVSVDVG